MGSKSREWVLSDNSTWTTTEVAEHVGISHSSAYHRLRKSTDIAHVLRIPKNIKRYGGKRLYKLDDGTEWTSTMVANHTGCPMSTASTRLSCYTDPERVLAPPKHSATKDKNVTSTVKQRMYFDPLGHWALLNKYV